jgi:hypothetical protein
MLISDRHRFIFIHVYKTGGTSIRSALKPYRDLPSLPTRVLARLGLCPHPGHASAREVRSRYPDRWRDYYTFAFVRNPWAWQVSLYAFMRQEKNHPQGDLARSFDSFRSYLEWRVDGNKRLQSEFVGDGEGQVLVDYIGRVETMQDDFQALCERLGIEASLPHKNTSSHRDYRSYYDAYTRDLVAEHFAPDIEHFGYTFDGIDASAAVSSRSRS